MDNLVFILSLWLIAGLSSGMIAMVKGRNATRWFLLGALCGVVSIPILVCLKTLPAEMR